MACCFASAEEREATRRSKEIDRYLEKERRRAAKEVKILLLGSNGSGRSTFLKQMRILYGRGYSKEDRLQLRPVIYGTILRGMKELISYQKRYQIHFQHSENKQKCQQFEDWCHATDRYHITDVEFSPVVELLMSLWRDEGVQEAIKRTDYYNLEESAFIYFMNNLETIGQLGYIPSTQDVLHSQTPTIGINEFLFSVNDTMTYRFITVGGARTERRRWIHVFEDLTCVLFFAASNEFDQSLWEDCTINRMAESIELFKQISHSRFLKSVPIILILNKTDLLSTKIMEKNIKDYFPDFEGNPHNLDDVEKFIIQMYNAARPDSTTSDIQSYVTTATDGGNIKTVFTMMKDKILTYQLYKIVDL